MMPRVTNNRRSVLVNSMKYTLFSFAVILLFAGVAITAENLDNPTAPISRGEKSDATGERQKTPLISVDNKFLASLRFWEKKDQPQPRPPVSASSSSMPGTPPPRPSESSLIEKSLTGQPGASTEHSATVGTATTSAAPEPPSIENSADVRMSAGNAPLPPGRSANFAYDSSEGNAPLPREANPGTASYLSYSFDTRDWVEFFPLHEKNETDEGVLMATQTTSFRLSNPPPSQNEYNEYKNDDWNGQATMLVTHVQREQIQPVQTAVVHTVPTSVSVEQPSIDLSPSYQNRLPYVQTCGVVVVQANFPLTEIAAILDEINLLQHDLSRYIGVPEPKEKIELCLFKDENSYNRFLKEFFPRAPQDRRALYVKLDNKPGTLMVQKSKNFEIDLRHEMTHAIIHASISIVPIWLDEGLAKYFEVPLHERAGGNHYMSQVRSNARFGAVPSLDRLVKLETIDDMGSREYRDSWAWTHFLIHRAPETHQLLAAYLQMLAKLPASRTKHSRIPSLKLYLDDIVPNQREAFKKHFSSTEK